MKKLMICLVSVGVLSFLIIGTAFAGSTLDKGQLETVPPVGEVNYIAWIGNRLTPNGAPKEIITEDSYNSGSGPNQGYGNQDIGVGWRIQIRNFWPYPAEGVPINFLFGGLGNSTGKIWKYSFDWVLSPSVTVHDIVPLTTTTGEACPAIVATRNEPTYKEVDFRAAANSKYHVYRTQLGSGAEPDNGLSNGRYQYLKSVTTNSEGFGTFSDQTQDQSWYIVLKADPVTNTPIGCHSEEAHPTAVTVFGFDAAYLAETGAIELTWDTASEYNLLGFKLLRSAHPDQSPELLAQVPVGNPGGAIGQAYRFQDVEVNPGETYYYWLDAQKLDGGVERLGPAQQFASYRLYLPLSVR